MVSPYVVIVYKPTPRPFLFHSFIYRTIYFHKEEVNRLEKLTVVVAPVTVLV